jgi:hypothetical protein
LQSGASNQRLDDGVATAAMSMSMSGRNKAELLSEFKDPQEYPLWHTKLDG